jgi:hypothetical protein
MLYTRNAFHFRKFYKEEIARESSYIDLNFVGSLHPDKRRRETGFSKTLADIEATAKCFWKMRRLNLI